jgi:dipeptidyl aminopeptidase/acylaminoacyl peptidase
VIKEMDNIVFIKKQTFALLFIIAVLLVACRPEAIDKSLKVKQSTDYTLEDFYNAPYLKRPIFSKSGDKVLISTNESGVFNAFELSLNDGKFTQLTNYSTNSAYGLAYFPNDERILFGLELSYDLFHLFVRNSDGTMLDITPDSTSKAIFVKWSEDKKSLYYLCNKRNNANFDLYKLKIVDIERRNLMPELLFENKEDYQFEGISKDENYLVLGKIHTKHNSDVFIFDRKTGKANKIIGNANSSNYVIGVTEDEKGIYYVTDEGSEFGHLNTYTFADKKQQTINEEKWDIEQVFFSPKNTYRALLINEDAQNKLKIYTNKDNKQVKIPNLPCGDISMVNFSEDEKQMCFLLNNPISPNDLYIYHFENKELRKITDLFNHAINPNDLVEPEFVKFKSFDSLEIPALLYKPAHLKKDAQVPAIVIAHGALGGQSRSTYLPIVQYLVNQGYVILMVNNRGSYGYGKTFAEADEGKIGEVDLKDYIAGKQFLENQVYVKKGQIGIMGAGAYGGYISLAALAFAPTEFAVGIDLFGITNWYKAMKSIPPSWLPLKQWLHKKVGNPLTDSLALHKKSPLFFAKEITQPLMIVQGANNARTPKSETDQIVNELKINKVPHRYLVLPDEAHFFTKKENDIKAHKEIVKFLDEFLSVDKEKAIIQ